MKKSVSFLLSMGLIMSLTACDLFSNDVIDNTNQTNEPVLNVKTTNNTEDSEKDSSNSKNSTEISDVKDNNPEVMKHIGYSIEKNDFSYWERNEIGGQDVILEAVYDSVKIPDEFPELKKLFDDANMKFEKEYSECHKAFEEGGKESEDVFPYYYKDRIIVNRADENYFSYLCEVTRGAEGETEVYYVPYVYNPKTAETVLWKDILKESDDLYDYITEFLLNNYDKECLFYQDYEQNRQLIESFFENDEEKARYIEVMPDGADLYFPEALLSPTDMRTIVIPIRYDEHPEFFADSFKVSEEKDYIRYLPDEFTWYEDIDADGKRECVSIFENESYNEIFGEMMYETLEIVPDGKEEIEIQLGAVENPDIYVGKRGNDIYLFADINPRISRLFMIFKLNADSMTAENVNNCMGDILTLDNFDRILFAPMLGVFSTFYSSGEYCLDENDKLLCKEEFTPVYGMDEHPLVTKDRIQGLKVDDKLNVTENKIDVETGSTLYFRYTNGTDSVIFENEDGELILIKRDEEYYIDGKHETDVFEMLYYYG